MTVSGRPFQDDLRENYCWGCGIANPHGLHIKSAWHGDDAVCVWQPAPEHMAGPRGVLNGGIIATIIDCHSICTAVADAYRGEGRQIGSDPLIWFVTGSLAVSYQRPAPLDRSLRVSARITERTGRKTVVAATVAAGEDPCATGEVVAVRVTPEWFQRYDAPGVRTPG
ncbi:MAG TPA: PaaI family thioesterase [bacterium]|jgi:acyl-coenzyme A thioesterase PaaI-like protein|nr:PaaI family thioesterase [bacterium]